MVLHDLNYRGVYMVTYSLLHLVTITYTYGLLAKKCRYLKIQSSQVAHAGVLVDLLPCL